MNYSTAAVLLHSTACELLSCWQCYKCLECFTLTVHQQAMAARQVCRGSVLKHNEPACCPWHSFNLNQSYILLAKQANDRLQALPNRPSATPTASYVFCSKHACNAEQQRQAMPYWWLSIPLLSLYINSPHLDTGVLTQHC